MAMERYVTVCLTQVFKNSRNFAFFAQFFVFRAIFFWNGFWLCVSHTLAKKSQPRLAAWPAQ
jgi:hypothetical protein